MVLLTFVDDDISVEETGGSVEVCLQLLFVIEPTRAPIWVDVSTEDSSATSKTGHTVTNFNMEVGFVTDSQSFPTA